MSEASSKLVAVLKRKYCNLPMLVSLLAERLQSPETDVKRILYELSLHKLEPKEDKSVGYTVHLTDEEIIENYLRNNKIYDSTYHTKPPLMIKWEKAVLINWLRSKHLEIPETWEQWIKNDYPILIKHKSTTILIEPESDFQGNPNLQNDSANERNEKLQNSINALSEKHVDIKTHEALCEKLNEEFDTGYSVSSIMRWTKSPYNRRK